MRACFHVRACVRACVRGCVGAWVRGCVGAWVRGCVGAWVRGCVGAWVRGCVGAYVYVFVCAVSVRGTCVFNGCEHGVSFTTRFKMHSTVLNDDRSLNGTCAEYHRRRLGNGVLFHFFRIFCDRRNVCGLLPMSKLDTNSPG